MQVLFNWDPPIHTGGVFSRFCVVVVVVVDTQVGSKQHCSVPVNFKAVVYWCVQCTMIQCTYQYNTLYSVHAGTHQCRAEYALQ